MGLDNGIYAKNINKKDIPDFIEFTDYGDEIEFAYWRKCWNIRDKILDCLDTENEEYQYTIKKNNICEIIKALKLFLSKEYWDKNNASIFEFEEQVENLSQVIINLMWLYFYVDLHLDVKIYFYDSY